jgi:predicted RNA-binding Zn ribbon-like protein
VVRFQPVGDPVALAVDLLNTADVLVTPPELLADPAALRRLLQRHALQGEPDDADIHAVRTVRGNLRKAFTAADEGAAADALNELLRHAGATPQLERDESGWQFVYRPARPSIAASVAAAAAVPLLEAIRDGDWERLGSCEAAPCSRVFVDRSRNRSRRFCSGTCADRFAQAAYRRRRSLESAQRAA